MLRSIPTILLSMLTLVCAPDLIAAPTIDATPPTSAVEGSSVNVSVDLQGRLANRTRYDLEANFAGASINVATNPDGVSYLATFVATPVGIQTLSLTLFATNTQRESQLLNDITNLETSIQALQDEIEVWQEEIDNLGNSFWDRIRKMMIGFRIRNNERQIVRAQADLDQAQAALGSLTIVVDNATYSIEVLLPTPQAPRLNAIPNQIAVVDEMLSFVITATDDNLGDTLTYSALFYDELWDEFVSIAPNGSIDSNTGLFSFRPAPNQLGDLQLQVTVTDQSGLSDQTQTTIHVVFATPLSFAQSNLGPGNDTSAALASGDLNGDGFVDLVTGNISGNNIVYMNDGTGNYTAGSDLGAGDFTFTLAEIGDLNGDGFPDIAVGRFGRLNTMHFNDGSGNFPTSTTFGGSNTRSLALADIDGDTDLDIAVGNDNGEATSILLNDGSGSFPSAISLPSSGHTLGVAIADMNNDGALDLVSVDRGGQNLVHLNTGALQFSASPFGLGSDFTQSLTLADMSGDGSMDIVIGNDNAGGGGIEVYFNDGLGAFTVSGFAYGSGMNVFALRSGDIDNDGDNDIVVGNFKQQNVIFWNDGSGNLLTTSGLGIESEPTRAIVLADFDGDAKLDVAVANNHGLNGQNRIYLNR